MNLRLARPELVVLTATAISAVNVLVVLGVLHVAILHLAVINVGLASVLGLIARDLVPSEPLSGGAAEGGARRREEGPA
jgi:hypothetical protein